MIVITDVLKRKNREGEEFLVLQIDGDPEVIMSKTTNKPYFTAKRTTVPCTFNEIVARTMIGKTMPGAIEKSHCEEYEYTTTKGEKIKLDFTYVYNPVPSTIEETVFG